MIRVLEIKEEDLLKDWLVTQPAYQVICFDMQENFMNEKTHEDRRINEIKCLSV